MTSEQIEGLCWSAIDALQANDVGLLRNRLQTIACLIADAKVDDEQQKRAVMRDYRQLLALSDGELLQAFA